MAESLKSFIEKWNKMDKKTRIIYIIIAAVLIAALIFTATGNRDIANNDNGGIDLNDNGNVSDTVEDTDTDGEGYDAAMSSTDTDAGGHEDADTAADQETDNTAADQETDNTVVYGQSYNSKDEVAEYLYLYGELPPNYITKREAEDLGWKSTADTVAQAAPGMSIGGDSFGNREGLLPKASGRKYYECDIDYVSGSRGAKRIVYSNDGLIFYTDDHYESFVQYDAESKTWK